MPTHLFSRQGLWNSTAVLHPVSPLGHTYLNDVLHQRYLLSQNANERRSVKQAPITAAYEMQHALSCCATINKGFPSNKTATQRKPGTIQASPELQHNVCLACLIHGQSSRSSAAFCFCRTQSKLAEQSPILICAILNPKDPV